MVPLNMQKENSMLSRYASQIEGFIDLIAKEREDAVMPSREQFTRLLAAPSGTRKVPGISGRMDENGEYICTEEEAKIVRDFLKKMYKVDSKESLIGCQKTMFRNSVEYEQFMTFWKEAPLFDIDSLNPAGRAGFEKMKSLAEPFCPLLEEKGFYAWDISEYINICRIARACGIVDVKEFDETVDRFVRKAQVFYHSFREYALSYLCGAMYFSSGFGNEKSMDQFFQEMIAASESIFSDNGVWSRYGWYVPAEREWVPVYPGNPACFVTLKALEKGVGYMYRDTPSADRPDSGWRFFYGDESDEYANDPANIKVENLNAICNLHPSILAFLEAPAGSAYGWNGKDWIRE